MLESWRFRFAIYFHPEESLLNVTPTQRFLMFFVAILVVGSLTWAAPASNSFKTIQNGGGTIVYGPLSFHAALNETLKQMDSDYGDHPQLGKVLQNKAGSVWEGFFTVTDKKKGGTKMTGLVIVYAPKPAPPAAQP